MLRLNSLLKHLTPVISHVTLSNVFGPDRLVDLNKNGFKIAFGVQDYNSGESMDDIGFVKWSVTLSTLYQSKIIN